ncbi:unnamed protein product [Brassica oleracea]
MSVLTTLPMRWLNSRNKSLRLRVYLIQWEKVMHLRFCLLQQHLGKTKDNHLIVRVLQQQREKSRHLQMWILLRFVVALSQWLWMRSQDSLDEVLRWKECRQRRWVRWFRLRHDPAKHVFVFVSSGMSLVGWVVVIG